MIAAAILLPLLGGAALWALGGRVAVPRRPGVLGTVAVAVLAATVAAAAAVAVDARRLEVTWAEDLVLTFTTAGVAGVVAVLVPAVALLVVAYASVHEAARTLPRLVGLLVVFVGVMEALVLADDLLTLTIAWELVAVCSWALIGSAWTRDDVVARAGHAFNATRAGSIGLVVAAGAVHAGTGTFAYDAIGALPRPLLDAAAAGILLAAVSKSAQLPFSPWLFSAMAGPTSVSALLHSATMVAAGAYALIRLGPALDAVGWFSPVVVGIGLATALVGGVVALAEVHGKRILAASTAAQYGLMFVAVGVGASGAAAAHLVAHAVLKSQLFLAVGVGLSATGTPDVRRWRLGARMPGVAAAAAVGALALGAVPPLGAAWTKEQIVGAAISSAPWIGALAFLSGLLSTIYALRLHLLAFRPDRDGAHTGERGDPALIERVSIAVLAAASVGLGALWVPGARGVVERLLGGEVESGHAWEIAVAVTLVALGAAIAVWAVRRGGAVVGDRVADAASGWFGMTTGARRVLVDPTLAAAAAAARVDDAVLDLPARVIGRGGAALAQRVGTFDDRVIDGVVRGVVGTAQAASRAITRAVERGVDGVVTAIATATERVGEVSRLGDDRGVDATVERLADAVGIAGTQTRRLQTGLAHHYYVIAAVGLIVILAVAATWR